MLPFSLTLVDFDAYGVPSLSAPYWFANKMQINCKVKLQILQKSRIACSVEHNVEELFNPLLQKERREQLSQSDNRRQQRSTHIIE